MRQGGKGQSEGGRQLDFVSRLSHRQVMGYASVRLLCEGGVQLWSSESRSGDRLSVSGSSTLRLRPRPRLRRMPTLRRVRSVHGSAL